MLFSLKAGVRLLQEICFGQYHHVHPLTFRFHVVILRQWSFLYKLSSFFVVELSIIVKRHL